ncbi:nucleoside recognition domain-containing protein [Desulfofalx alkaliphila]|uniref:nucleoside recognition domain-containing protein n=1 Tax=Desulfofalx alkaliphila TaxID=105483 RepID=UPI0004E28B14|nr:nucleoside recognition domain-containing protein [Desulfofalx alkaliphila]
MVTTETFKRGITKGIGTTWELVKVVVPVYIFVTFLSHTPLFDWLAGVCQPFMHYLGLPGEASLAIIMGYFLNIYAAIGVMVSLSLTHKQITILAVMLLICHSIFVETAICKRTGVNGTPIVIIRLVLSILSAVVLNFAL